MTKLTNFKSIAIAGNKTANKVIGGIQLTQSSA